MSLDVYAHLHSQALSYCGIYMMEPSLATKLLLQSQLSIHLPEFHFLVDRD